jgi:hypothetical protein
MKPRIVKGPAAFVLALAALALVLMHGGAQAAGPFDGMGGEWSGGGVLSMTDGKRERLRCRANYTAGDDGNMLQIAIRCASDSYRFDLTGYMRNQGGRISGQWSETTFNAAGSLSGSAGSGRLNALAVGNTFSARLSMSTSGSRQSLTIRPEGTQVDRVSLSLSKR